MTRNVLHHWQRPLSRWWFRFQDQWAGLVAQWAGQDRVVVGIGGYAVLIGALWEWQPDRSLPVLAGVSLGCFLALPLVRCVLLALRTFPGATSHARLVRLLAGVCTERPVVFVLDVGDWLARYGGPVLWAWALWAAHPVLMVCVLAPFAWRAQLQTLLNQLVEKGVR